MYDIDLVVLNENKMFMVLYGGILNFGINDMLICRKENMKYVDIIFVVVIYFLLLFLFL